MFKIFLQKMVSKKITPVILSIVLLH